jgi:glucokinase
MNTIVAGIDMGGTNTVVGLVTSEGECLCEKTFRTQESPDFSGFIVKVIAVIGALQKELDNKYTLVGVGIGAPNGSYITGEIINAPNLRWKGVLPLSSDLSSKLGVPVFITNDANAATLGEMHYGAARGMKNFVYITLGTGLGSGFVVDGNLLLGNDGFAGELGHTSVKPSGRKCGCGKKGCLETYVSAPGLRRTAFKLLSDSLLPSALRSRTYDNISARVIAELALQGDKVAQEAFEYTGEVLGIALANVVAMLNPEAIFLFGGLSNAGNLIFEPTKRYMEKNLSPIFKNKVKLLPSGLGDKNAAVLGAAALIWEGIAKNNQ